MMIPKGSAAEILRNPNAIELANNPGGPHEGQMRLSMQQQGKREELRNQELSAQSAAKIMDTARRMSVNASTPEHQAEVMLRSAVAGMQEMAGAGFAKQALAEAGDIGALIKQIYS